MAPAQPNLIYQIRIKGQLAEKWIEWLNGSILELVNLETAPSETVLLISIPDQAALRGIVNKLWDLNLILIAVHQIEI